LKKNVLQSLLGEKIRQQRIIVVDKIELENYKTKEVESFLNSFPSKGQKSLVILGEKEENKEKIIRSLRNLPYINISDSRLVNPLQILPPHYLIFTQSAFSEVEKRLN
jgi:large subunit ribosomal protein L4